MGEIRNIYKILVGKNEGKRQFGRPRRRWEDNIRINRREIGWEIYRSSCVTGVLTRSDTNNPFMPR